jgi:hypothetical protein
MSAASTDICSKCGRTRPSYIADPSCSKDGYCDWVPSDLRERIQAALNDDALNTPNIWWKHKRTADAARILLPLALAELAKITAELDKLRAEINTPELYEFGSGVVHEAQHQRARWGSDHDAGKTPADWFWLVGYLAGKCLASHIAGHTDKALHQAIATAAALGNWHAAILGKTNMRPGIDHQRGVCEEATCPECAMFKTSNEQP